MTGAVLAPTGQVWRVVIVDDSPDDRAEVRRLLLRGSDRRYSFTEAETGAAGVRAVLESTGRPPDCVLLDFNLPDMDAPEVLAGLAGPDGLPVCPVVVLTGQAGPETGRAVLRAGAQDYIGKDWSTPESLTRAVENAAERWAMVRELRDRQVALQASHERLQEERDRFTRIAATAPGVIYSFRLRPDGTNGLPYASPGITAIYGLRPEDLADDASATLGMVHPDDADRVRTSIQQSAQTLASWQQTFRICPPNASEKWIECHSTPIREPDGSTLWHGFLTDVTDRKRDEAALHFQHALLRCQAEASPDGILVVGSGNRVLSHNRRFLDMWGMSEEPLIAGDDAPLLTLARSRTADPDGFAERVAAIYADPDIQTHDEVALADGRTLDRCSGPIRGEGGVALGRIWFFRDITDSRRAEVALSDQVQANAVRAAIAVAIARPGDIRAILQECCEVLVREMGVAFARVWALDAAEEILELQSSAGLYTHIDGPHARVPVGKFKIGQIASERQPHLTNSVVGDPKVPEQAWVTRERLVAFGGYPLLVEGRLVGVLAMFSRKALSPANFEHLAVVADLIAQCIDRKRAEAALRGSEERYRQLMDVLPTAVFIHTGDKIVFCNPAYVRLMGATKAEDLLGKSPFDMAHPDHHAALHTRLAAMREDREAGGGIELNAVRVDGQAVPVHSVSILIPLPDGGRQAYLVAMSDMTERERSAGLLRSVLGSVNDAILTIDEFGTVQSANPATERLFGYAEAEVVGENVRMLMPGPYRREHDGYLRDYLRTGVAKVIGIGREVEGLRKDGTRFPADLTVTEFFLGGVRHFTGVVRDITERKRSEVVLRQAQQRLTHVLASSPAVLFTLRIEHDEVQGINWISDNLQEVLGYPPGAASDPNWWSGNVHTDDWERVIAQTQTDLFVHGRTSYEYRFRHGDGKYRWTRGEVRLVRDAAGVPAEAVGSWSDITERKQLEEQFRQAQKMEAVGQLAGGVAHDFNNMLTVINGYSAMLLEQMPATDRRRELLVAIQDAGERASGLTAQLLAFSRKAIVEPKVLDVNKLTDASMRMLRRLIGENIRLVADLAPGLAQVKIDPGQLDQVLMNLAVNARDAMPRGGTITIATANQDLPAGEPASSGGPPPGRYVQLSVSDTGSGMTDEVKARIFEPFFTTKGVGKGTGLGLATVFGIVQHAGGTISVESEVGRGARFCVLLPAVSETVTMANSAEGRVASRGTETVLLVEDEAGVRGFVRGALEMLGYVVVEADCGADALQVAASHPGPIHLLVTDVVMPDIGGRELANEIRASRADLRVLYMSGYTDDAVVRHGIEAAEVSFLQKPFSPLALARKVREVLDREPQMLESCERFGPSPSEFEPCANLE